MIYNRGEEAGNRWMESMEDHGKSGVKVSWQPAARRSGSAKGHWSTPLRLRNQRLCSVQMCFIAPPCLQDLKQNTNLPLDFWNIVAQH